MAVLPMEQAVTGAMEGPKAPYLMLIMAAAILAIIMGTSVGLTRSGPREASSPLCPIKVWMPPIPEPTYTPIRSRSMPSSRKPACVKACSAAARASWQNRSIRRASFAPNHAAGSKSFTSPAILTLCLAVSKLPICPMPDFPRTSPDQKVSTSLPSGDITPIPVITTLSILKSAS
ncbi:hypothetical protein D3C75_831730 [compost metagenome]